MSDVPQPGQVYQAAKPGDGPQYVRLTQVGEKSAAAVDHATGQALPRRVPLARLHAGWTTPNGRLRTAGWVLDHWETRVWAEFEQERGGDG